VSDETSAAGSTPAPRAKILVVDDEEGIRTQLRWGLGEAFDVACAGDPAGALQAIEDAVFDGVTLDLGLPPDSEGATEGLRLLEAFLAKDPALKIVVLTGNADHQNALRAVQLGAYDYYQKPLNIEELRLILERACRLSRLDRETIGLRTPDAERLDEAIVCESPAMRKVMEVVRRTARTDVTVLISGESGTGKELVARAIHAQSPRHARPFVAINCSAIPETLIEGELFGHEKGAFTGAHTQRRGRLEMADGGTVFLDEIGDLTPAAQVKLLRVLQERKFERVGGREVIDLDVRVLAATNRDIRDAMLEGSFREDLYYRLAVVSLTIAPLRERPEDLRALAQVFLQRFSKEFQLQVRAFSKDAMDAMETYAWPGNVRELENRIKRAAIMADGRRITPADMDLSGSPGLGLVSLKEARSEAERRVLLEALQRTRGNISRAAKLVELSRPAFHELLIKHGVKIEGFKSSERGGSGQSD
jgi:two-component system NtrC family response regulator